MVKRRLRVDARDDADAQKKKARDPREEAVARTGEPVPEKPVLVQVLCVRDDGAVLLRKNEDGPLTGLSTGLLGPVETGETLEAAAARIAGAPDWVIGSLQRVAVFDYLDAGEPTAAVEHEFIARGCSGDPPIGARWVERPLDYATMPADDRHWYGRVLDDGELLSGSFAFGSEKNELLGKGIVRAVSALIDKKDDGEQEYTSVQLPNGDPSCDVQYTD